MWPGTRERAVSPRDGEGLAGNDVEVPVYDIPVVRIAMALARLMKERLPSRESEAELMQAA
jgi:hypothetical protein